MDDYWVWGGSVTRGDDGRYHMFASRWPRRLPFFEGYMVASETVRAVSGTPEGPYVLEEVIMPQRGEDYWDGRMTHNPTIHRVGSTYLLFYIGSTYGGRMPSPQELAQGGSGRPGESYSRIRIGLATSESVLGPWERRDVPVLSPRPGKWDGSVVTNPAPCIREDGKILLYYRSNTPEGLRIGVAEAADIDSPFERLRDDPVLRFGGGNHVEDPYVWWAKDHYEMLAKDLTGGLTGERHSGLHAFSHNGVDWCLPDPPKAYSRMVAWDDGSITLQGCLERPQVLVENGRATHLFLATAEGPGGFRNAARTWNMVIPLAPGQ
jgi:hypothetical protein